MTEDSHDGLKLIMRNELRYHNSGDRTILIAYNFMIGSWSYYEIHFLTIIPMNTQSYTDMYRGHLACLQPVRKKMTLKTVMAFNELDLILTFVSY